MELQSLRPHSNYRRVPSNQAQDEPTSHFPPSPYNGERGRTSLHRSAKEYASSKLRCSMGWAHGAGTTLLDRKTYKSLGFHSEEDDSENTKPSRGWRKAVVAAAVLTGVVLFINLVFLLVGVTRFAPSRGIGTIYTGNCKYVKHWDTVLHLLINILATAVLGASNFTMQCLSSPTRSEVDRAHEKKISLDIGLASIKNLFYVDWKKGVLWWALTLSTLPLHLLWNSTIFATLGANEFSTVVVDEGFIHGDPFKTPYDTCDTYLLASSPTPNFATIYEAYRAGNYSQRLSPADCINANGLSIVSGRRNLLAITEPVARSTKMSPSCAFAPSANGISSYDYVDVSQPLWNGSSVLAFENHGTNLDLRWLCWGYYDSVNIDRTDASCDRRKAQSLLVENGTWYLRPFDTSTADEFSQSQAYPIKYCLSEDKVPEKCRLQYASTILGIVIACNFVKMAAMVATAVLVWNLEEPIFATVGDAVASYLERPDESTAGWCLMGSNETSAWRRLTLEQDTHKLYKPPKLRLLIAATSKTRYVTTMGLCILYLAAGFVLWFLSVKQAKQYYSMSQVWALGLGDINEYNTLNIHFQTRFLASESVILIINILIANSFQLALSITYFLYNSLYTAQCGAIEWTSYTLKRKPLRVTHPSGQQRSTYWLQLPYTYGLLLSGFLMLMHFLISQAVFLARVQWYDDFGEESDSISSLGYSPVGIMASCCVGGFLILCQLLHSLRPLKTGIPLHCNKSTVISASCHPEVPSSGNEQDARMSDVRENMALSRVMWGVVLQPKDNNGVGHCSFTSYQVEMPERGERYR